MFIAYVVVILLAAAFNTYAAYVDFIRAGRWSYHAADRHRRLSMSRGVLLRGHCDGHARRVVLAPPLPDAVFPAGRGIAGAARDGVKALMMKARLFAMLEEKHRLAQARVTPVSVNDGPRVSDAAGSSRPRQNALLRRPPPSQHRPSHLVQRECSFRSKLGSRTRNEFKELGMLT
jgi:hypothetical protein